MFGLKIKRDFAIYATYIKYFEHFVVRCYDEIRFLALCLFRTFIIFANMACNLYKSIRLLFFVRVYLLFVFI